MLINEAELKEYLRIRDNCVICYECKPDPKRQSCYWYGGKMVEVDYKGYTFIIGAYGDVIATYTDKEKGIEEYVKDKNNSGRFLEEIGFYIKDDNALMKAMQDGTLVFDANNWYEVLIDGPDGKHHDLGWVLDSELFYEALKEMVLGMDDAIYEIGGWNPKVSITMMSFEEAFGG